MKALYLPIAALLIPLLLVLAAGAILYRPGPPRAAQAVLDAYLALHAPAGGWRAEARPVLSLTRAPRPGAFTRAMSQASYADGYYFSATHTLEGAPNAEQGRPAPYPVTDLWCITLAPHGANQAPQLLLLAEHEDLHVAEWQLHAPSAAAAGLCP